MLCVTSDTDLLYAVRASCSHSGCLCWRRYVESRLRLVFLFCELVSLSVFMFIIVVVGLHSSILVKQLAEIQAYILNAGIHLPVV